MGPMKINIAEDGATPRTPGVQWGSAWGPVGPHALQI